MLPIMALMALLAARQTSSALPGIPNVTSPEVTEPLSQSRRRLASMQGRKNTLLTGGLLGNPPLLRQGLGGIA